MTTSQRNDDFDHALVVRAVVFIATLLVLALLVVNLVQAGDRASSPTRERVDELVITKSDEPASFDETVVWSLPSQAASFTSVEDRPVVTLDDGDVGALVGLRGPEGLVGLALLPAGLGEPPAELRISPTSTALAIAALHPELMSGDVQTHLASMVAISLAPSFPELVARVDGRALTSWQADDRSVLAQVVVEAGLPAAEPTCPAAESVEGLISICPGTGEIQNGDHRTALVLGADGDVCAVVPARVADVATDGRMRLATMIALGGVPASPIDAIALRPGRADGAACGSPLAVADSDDADASTVSVWVDVTQPLGRLFGVTAQFELSGAAEDILTAVFAATPEVAIGQQTSAERAVAAVRYLQSPSGASQLGLLPPTTEALERLDDLSALFEVLYA